MNNQRKGKNMSLNWLMIKHAVLIALLGTCIGLLATPAKATDYYWINGVGDHVWVGTVYDGHNNDAVYSTNYATIARMYKQANAKWPR